MKKEKNLSRRLCVSSGDCRRAADRGKLKLDCADKDDSTLSQRWRPHIKNSVWFLLSCCPSAVFHYRLLISYKHTMERCVFSVWARWNRCLYFIVDPGCQFRGYVNWLKEYSGSPWDRGGTFLWSRAGTAGLFWVSLTGTRETAARWLTAAIKQRANQHFKKRATERQQPPRWRVLRLPI